MCFSLVNLIFRCLLSRKVKKSRDSWSFLKADKMTPKYLKQDFDLFN